MIKKSSRQQLNNEIGRHKTSLKKLDEALKTIEDLKVIIKEKDKLIGHSNIYSHRSIAQNLSRRYGHSVEITEFFIPQILREIIIGESKVSRSAIFTLLKGSEFVFWWIFALVHQINKIQTPKNGENGIFRTSKIDFTQNLSDRKILKFPILAYFSFFHTVPQLS